MPTSSSDLPQESLQIKQDDRFFNRLLSRETSMVNGSCRVYYGVEPGAVPFMWESRPGTPKNTTSTTSTIPLSPPPSYLYNSEKGPNKKNSKFNLLKAIFPRLTLRKPHAPPPSSSLPSSWSISSSSRSSSTISLSSLPSSVSSSSKSSNSHRRSPFPSGREIEHHHGISSPTSTLCFGVGRASNGGALGCNSMAIMKNALMSMVGNGSNTGTA